MKKRILSLILVLMLVPFASMFSACGKEKGYNLNNLKSDFMSIETENNNVKFNDDLLTFDYSSHGRVQRIISETEPYAELNKYNDVFKNMMRFASLNIAKCSSNSATDNVEIKNQVQAELNEFKKSVNDVNQCFNLFSEMILVSQANLTSQGCLNRFENLIKSYDVMFESGRNFNNTLSNLYFNHILNNGNPNVYAIGENNFNSSVVVSKIRSRIDWQISNLSANFAEMYIDADLARDIVNNGKSFDLNKFNYETNIKNLMGVENLNETTATEKANEASNKSKFFELSVQAQNIQTVLNNENSKYIYACNEIDYTNVLDSAAASANEEMCAKVIEENNNLILAYNQVLYEMLVIMLG